MDSDAVFRKDAFLTEEYLSVAKAAEEQSFEEAWHHLERAHVVAQDRFGPHCVAHWRMLRLAWRVRDWREVRGQMFRLALAPLGNAIGKLPVGNSGRSNVSAFAEMEIEPEIRRVLGLSPTRDDCSSKKNAW
ncbi:DUF3703 domain-containing protein [Novosphingobium malaysiense]|jgi:hypothetical protein|uniref:DUF3703 domain-containing protein n=1 Tax=Novosphingobium malaysiense TaxID=1348853 RepID=A0A0B1ZW66_9SPHN|nr:DUF3703 domain-containing protein [Novosphingobium malaysiense]KHK93397.1 hypothetical protein LK12_03690 [Novosphingobium malaysiense]MCP5399927.1 DUF3703 domain-containing protein [Sphingomonas sp.]